MRPHLAPCSAPTGDGFVFRFVAALCLVALGLCARAEKPKLVVFISVDQLRGDHLLRLEDRLGEGGFRYLMQHGTWYTSANYRHASTVTAVGHATLVTGANPPEHGIVENRWYSRDTGAMEYCVQDADHHLLGVEGKPEDGTSPKNLMVSTIGDELAIASGGRSRVFGVSFKDRAAMLMAGHLGKAFWFHSGSGRFITSDYYYTENPAWVNAWNDTKYVDQFRQATWDLLKPRETYAFRDQDDRPIEKTAKVIGTTFPHDLKQVPPTFFNSALSGTPFGDKTSLEFAKQLVTNEKLGQSGVTDMLCLSLSSTDVIGHVFGPTSLEMEDIILQLDASLADFFTFLNSNVGLDNCVFALSADHGGHEVSEHTATLNFPGKRIDRKEIIPAINAALKEKFGVDNLLTGIEAPHCFLNVPAIREAKLDEGAVEEAAAAAFRQQPGILYALTRNQILDGRIPDVPAIKRLARSFNAKRGGGVLVAEEPYWYFYNGDQSGTHSGPWAYDTYVPVIIAGASINSQRVAREVAPEDIAVTLANILGIMPPSGNTGNVLVEALPKGH